MISHPEQLAIINRSHSARGYSASPLSNLSIAYHYFIDGDGSLTKVRSDGERTQHTSCGMELHKCTGAEQDINGKSVAIALAGDFNNEKPTRKQMSTLMQLVGTLQMRYGIPSEKVLGHREASPTACPGKNMMEILYSYRHNYEKIAEKDKK